MHFLPRLLIKSEILWSEGESLATVLKLYTLEEQHPSSVVKPLVDGRLSSNSFWKGLLAQRNGAGQVFNAISKEKLHLPGVCNALLSPPLDA